MAIFVILEFCSSNFKVKRSDLLLWLKQVKNLSKAFAENEALWFCDKNCLIYDQSHYYPIERKPYIDRPIAFRLKCHVMWSALNLQSSSIGNSIGNLVAAFLFLPATTENRVFSATDFRLPSGALMLLHSVVVSFSSPIQTCCYGLLYCFSFVFSPGDWVPWGKTNNNSVSNADERCFVVGSEMSNMAFRQVPPIGCLCCLHDVARYHVRCDEFSPIVHVVSHLRSRLNEHYSMRGSPSLELSIADAGNKIPLQNLFVAIDLHIMVGLFRYSKSWSGMPLNNTWILQWSKRVWLFKISAVYLDTDDCFGRISDSCLCSLC